MYVMIHIQHARVCADSWRFSVIQIIRYPAVVVQNNCCASLVDWRSCRIAVYSCSLDRRTLCKPSIIHWPSPSNLPVQGQLWARNDVPNLANNKTKTSPRDSMKRHNYNFIFLSLASSGAKNVRGWETRKGQRSLKIKRIEIFGSMNVLRNFWLCNMWKAEILVWCMMHCPKPTIFVLQNTHVM